VVVAHGEQWTTTTTTATTVRCDTLLHERRVGLTGASASACASAGRALGATAGSLVGDRVPSTASHRPRAVDRASLSGCHCSLLGDDVLP
jgi:hypothetical protein